MDICRTDNDTIQLCSICVHSLPSSMPWEQQLMNSGDLLGDYEIQGL